MPAVTPPQPGAPVPARPHEIAARLADVRARIAAAARRAGRDPGDVLLVGATKAVPAELVSAAARAGLGDVGENRAQELRAKQEALRADATCAGLRWHFLGAVQRNKVRAVVGAVVLVHGIDTPALARAVSDRARRSGVVQDVLLEVNLGAEPTKRGVALADVDAAVAALIELGGIRLRGFMTIPPPGDPDATRRHFATLRAARDGALERFPSVRELSMGMSDDFEAAIEEGATIVRVGTAIFGPRPALGGGRA